MSEMPNIERPWDAPKLPPRPPMKRSTKIAVLSVCGALIVGLAVVNQINASDKPVRDTSNATRYDDISAYATCQERVSAQLKAPATAGFPTMREFGGFSHSFSDSGKSYRMVAWVDSQNSFGAQVRTAFTCTAVDQGNGSWSAQASLG